jgi:glucose/arabinose dehydrogenase
VLPRPFLDLRGHVTTTRSRGLVGLEPDPSFARNGQVYVMYAFGDTARVVRFTASGDRASRDSEVVVLGTEGVESCEGLPLIADCINADGIHMGGGLDFASDGTLFVGTGDGQEGKPGVYEPKAERAQDLDALTGKVLRVTRAGKGLASNPYWTGSAGDNRSKVWAYGLRNPFRLAVRPMSLVPYVGDVGWDTWEEIDVARRGANLGWPCYEGRVKALRYRDTPLCVGLYAQPVDRPVRFPLAMFQHDFASSITGGDHRGRSEYVYGDYGKWWLRTLRVDSRDALVAGSDEFLASGTQAPTQIRIGPDGDLYYLSIAGTLYRIRPSDR